MDQNQNSEAAYISMLTRNIPGVGTTPLHSTTTTTQTNFSTSSAPTAKQLHAINILEGAIRDALFVSEGEEPFQVVHIVPKQSAPVAESNTNTLPPPSKEELLKILSDSMLIPLEASELSLAHCEQLPDLKSIINDTNPGTNNIAVALKDIFSSEPTAYRVSLPSSSTRVHLWILGWLDCHLLGLHTISIES